MRWICPKRHSAEFRVPPRTSDANREINYSTEMRPIIKHGCEGLRRRYGQHTCVETWRSASDAIPTRDYGDNIPGTVCDRKSNARRLPSGRGCRLESARRSAGPCKTGSGGRERAPARFVALTSWPHASFSFYVLSRSGTHDGFRPGIYSRVRRSRPVLRRRTPL